MDPYALGRAAKAEQNALEWKAFAQELQRQLRGAQANLAGMEALKDAALAQLAKCDPRNGLMVQQNRQRIFDEAYDAVASRKR